MVHFLGEVVSDLLEVFPEALALLWRGLDPPEEAPQDRGGTDGTERD